MLVYTGHVVSILVFITVIITSLYMAATLKSSTIAPCYFWVPKVIIVLLIMQSSVFLLLQADYLLGSHGVSIREDHEGAIKALYAILNGITLVMFATGMNILFRWKSKIGRCKVGCPLVEKHGRIH